MIVSKRRTAPGRPSRSPCVTSGAAMALGEDLATHLGVVQGLLARQLARDPEGRDPDDEECDRAPADELDDRPPGHPVRVVGDRRRAGHAWPMPGSIRP